ncbi:TPA: hypothetical protein JLS89_004780 [Escherichia coli]|uniref:hypothetical protein n=1 Tax=Escherichia TaxID=561 RepID=UPI0007434603|nr:MULTISPECIES: hypothetical protein [Escherichia]EEC3461634.1 hypothetical protein [Salmonella enterica]AML05812.1 hypothetical protein AVR74_14020 [Escherichia coli]EEU9589800.1 hypothetical protein [Escherichia coli]EEX1825362.1 hypothetical protein [Escherichia coli]EFB2307692.1 hypothetical protein [Escherichia coli]
MLQPAKKASVISARLTKYLKDGVRIDDFSFRRMLREIEALRDPVSEDYLLALVYGAHGQVNEAIGFFERSLQVCHNEVVAKNFLVFLSDYGTLKKSFETSIKLAESFISPFIYLQAYENSLFMGKMALAEKYFQSYSKLFGDKEPEKMDNHLDEVVSQVESFKQRADLSGLEYELIFNNVANVMDSQKVHLSGMRFYNISEEKVNAIVFMTKSSDAEQIADMNIELAFSMAEHDCLVGKDFAVWFECKDTHIEQNAISELGLITRRVAHAG